MVSLDLVEILHAEVGWAGAPGGLLHHHPLGDTGSKENSCLSPLNLLARRVLGAQQGPPGGQQQAPHTPKPRLTCKTRVLGGREEVGTSLPPRQGAPDPGRVPQSGRTCMRPTTAWWALHMLASDELST